MPAKIYLIRHGETDYNKVPRMQGWLDIPLNDTGRTQAQKTAESLASHHIDAIYSSDLIRAHDTAKPLAALHKLEVTVTPHLRERHMGIFTDWAWEHERDPMRDALWPEFNDARDSGDHEWNKHQGESTGQVVARLNELFTHLRAHHRDQNVALITHGGTINLLFEHLEIKKSVEGYRAIGNGAVHVLVKQTNTYIMEDFI